MTERRTILLVDEISDDDCGMYRLGEIDTIPDGQVQAYIQRRGEFGYSELLNFCASLMASARTCIHKYRESQHSPSQTTAEKKDGKGD